MHITKVSLRNTLKNRIGESRLCKYSNFITNPKMSFQLFVPIYTIYTNSHGSEWKTLLPNFLTKSRNCFKHNFIFVMVMVVVTCYDFDIYFFDYLGVERLLHTFVSPFIKYWYIYLTHFFCLFPFSLSMSFKNICII